MSGRHPPFAEVQASRPEYDPQPFIRTKTLEQEWLPGTGLSSSHPGAAQCQAACDGQVPFKVVQPGVTKLGPGMLYKIMIGAVAPRPVALVGTYGPDGAANVAPISWYQMVSSDPPLLMVSFGGTGKARKDSEMNIRRTGEFTISSSNEPFAEALNYSSVDAPPQTSEFTLTGLTPVPSRLIKAPRVGESPISFELKVHSLTDFTKDDGTPGGCMVIGRVQMVYLREDIIEADGAIDPAKTFPISRFGGLLYGRSTRGFELQRPVYDDVKGQDAIQEALQKGSKVPKEGAAGSKDPIAEAYP